MEYLDANFDWLADRLKDSELGKDVYQSVKNIIRKPPRAPSTPDAPSRTTTVSRAQSEAIAPSTPVLPYAFLPLDSQFHSNPSVRHTLRQRQRDCCLTRLGPREESPKGDSSYPRAPPGAVATPHDSQTIRTADISPLPLTGIPRALVHPRLPQLGLWQPDEVLVGWLGDLYPDHYRKTWQRWVLQRIGSLVSSVHQCLGLLILIWPWTACKGALAAAGRMPRYRLPLILVRSKLQSFERSATCHDPSTLRIRFYYALNLTYTMADKATRRATYRSICAMRRISNAGAFENNRNGIPWYIGRDFGWKLLTLDTLSTRHSAGYSSPTVSFQYGHTEPWTISWMELSHRGAIEWCS